MPTELSFARSTSKADVVASTGLGRYWVSQLVPINGLYVGKQVSGCVVNWGTRNFLNTLWWISLGYISIMRTGYWVGSWTPASDTKIITVFYFDKYCLSENHNYKLKCEVGIDKVSRHIPFFGCLKTDYSENLRNVHICMNALKFISGSSYSTVLTIIKLITELDWKKNVKNNRSSANCQSLSVMSSSIIHYCYVKSFQFSILVSLFARSWFVSWTR